LTLTRTDQVRQVLLRTLFLNFIVSLLKVGYGLHIGSVSMTADGFHSMFDGVSNVVGLLGLWISSKPPDADHPYGHRKYETLSTVAISVMMFATSFSVLKQAFSGLAEGSVPQVEARAFGLMAGTLVINIWVSWYEERRGRELKSDLLLADAKHTRSDIYATLAVLVSLVGVKLGLPWVDPVIALVITVMIARMGFHVLKSASHILVDSVMLDEARVRAIVSTVDGVKGCHAIRTRGPEDQIWLDLHVLVAPDLRTDLAHERVHMVISAIRAAIPEVVDVVVHVEPFDPARESETSGKRGN